MTNAILFILFLVMCLVLWYAQSLGRAPGPAPDPVPSPSESRVRFNTVRHERYYDVDSGSIVGDTVGTAL